ncbi:MAG: hypothetical protein LBF88_00955 [Planctomycetaceae bacterium]|jgi:hypothetical protein|nr:hypothetical protein [Planctomycetaceae bacterium]
MFFLSFLPLACYFFWLALLQNRRQPAIFNGVQDFMFLSCGLFGLFTLGPGRLLIPIDVIAFWGWAIWLFGTTFYFSAAYLIAQKLSQRIVIYHCPSDIFVPKLIEYAQKLDTKTRFEGNVLFLPDFGIQCTITADAWGQLLVLKPTGDGQDLSKWRAFEQNATAVCRTFQNPVTPKALLKEVFFFSLLLLTIAGFFVYEASALADVFFDYWN